MLIGRRTRYGAMPMSNIRKDTAGCEDLMKSRITKTTIAATKVAIRRNIEAARILGRRRNHKEKEREISECNIETIPATAM
jgi:hypothetical protein